MLASFSFTFNRLILHIRLNGMEKPEKNQISLEVKKVGLWSLKSVRLRIALLSLLLIFFTGGVRFSLSMAMVCMMNSTALALMSEDSNQFIDPPENTTRNATHGECVMSHTVRAEYEGPLVWTSDQQGLVFSALGWGGFLTSIPSGWLADRYGPKNLFLLDGVLHFILVVISPIVALRGGYVALFVVRLIIGAAQGCEYPCISALISKWFPGNERSTMLGLITAGNQLAAVTWTPLAAVLCQHKEFLGGWPSISYVLGIFGVMVCILWPFVMSNSAERSSKISQLERNYILLQLGGQSSESRKAATKVIPWRAMFTSVPVLVVMFCEFCNGLFFGLLISYVPTYFKDVLLLDLNSNGAYAILPWLVMGIGKVIPPYFGSFGTASLLIGLSFAKCYQPFLALACLTLASLVCPLFIAGFNCSELCIAPKFSGTIMSVGVMWFQVGWLVSAYVVGVITVHGTQSEWRTVFLVISASQILAGCVFGLFGTVTVQPWALSSKESQASLVYGNRKQSSAETDLSGLSKSEEETICKF